MIELFLFFVLAAVSIFGALTVVFAKNAVYGAMGLMMTLFSLAVFYVSIWPISSPPFRSSSTPAPL